MDRPTIAGVAARVRRVPAAGLQRLRRTGRALKHLLTDRSARPALAYLLAVALAGASVLKFLVGGGGEIASDEMLLLLASVGVVLTMSLSLSGNAPRRR